MSWDVLIFNFDGPLPDEDVMKVKGYQPPPVGDADTVRKKISDSVPEINWSNPGYGVLRGVGFWMDFSYQEDGIVKAFSLHLYGGGDPMPTIKKIR